MGLTANEKTVIRDLSKKSFYENRDFLNEYFSTLGDKELKAVANIIHRIRNMRKGETAAAKNGQGSDVSHAPDKEPEDVKPIVGAAEAAEEDGWSD